MDWFSAPDYWMSRLVFQRLLGGIYLVAFISTLNQFRPLLGADGLLPASRFLQVVPFKRSPSIFHLHYSDRFAMAMAWTGVLLASAAVLGLPERGPLWLSMLVWAALWVLYLSFVNVGQISTASSGRRCFWRRFYRHLHGQRPHRTAPFGHPPASLAPRSPGGGRRAHQAATRSGLARPHRPGLPPPDPAPAQPAELALPSPAQGAPQARGGSQPPLPADPALRLFLPQPFAAIAGGAIVAAQVWLILSGNYAWLNFLTIALAASSFDDDILGRLLPLQTPDMQPAPGWFQATVMVVAVAMAVLSYWPVRNMASSSQVMNYSYNPLRLVNTYGLFGSITTQRYEVVIEGTDEAQLGPETTWREYAFKAKPGDPHRRPRQVAPYHLRLDWLMWFVPLSGHHTQGWFLAFLLKLLQNDRGALALLATNPFPDSPPKFVRARLYRYRYATGEERAREGAWWVRELVGDYLPPHAGASIGAGRKRRSRSRPCELTPGALVTCPLA